MSHRILSLSPNLPHFVQSEMKFVPFGAIFAKNTSGAPVQIGTKFAYNIYSVNSAKT